MHYIGNSTDGYVGNVIVIKNVNQTMPKLKKCLYLIDLLSRRGPMTLKEINEHYSYSSIYDGEIIPRTFARYKDYIAETFPCSIAYNPATREYYLKRERTFGDDDSLYKYLLSAYHIEGMTELVMNQDRIKLMDAPDRRGEGAEKLEAMVKEDR